MDSVWGDIGPRKIGLRLFRITILLVYSSGFDVLLGHVQQAAMEAHKKKKERI